MTDTDLLDGLQKLFDANVVALRSCRSGAKIDLAVGEIMWGDQTQAGHPEHHREYFGGGDPPTYQNGNGAYGADIRVAIQRAIDGEEIALKGRYCR